MGGGWVGLGGGNGLGWRVGCVGVECVGLGRVGVLFRHYVMTFGAFWGSGGVFSVFRWI